MHMISGSVGYAFHDDIILHETVVDFAVCSHREILALRKMRGDEDGPIKHLNYNTDIRNFEFGLFVWH